jgi:16S rRNA (guanine527-N7)-methyltransferase
VVDLGSGGGLPGVVVAAMVPSAHVVLLEPMERRCVWLQEVVDELGLTNAEVCRGRAEDVRGRFVADAVTARAVTALDRLYGWAAPLTRAGGHLLAIKGDRASQELEASRAEARRSGWGATEVVVRPTVEGVSPTRVVRAVREEARRVR